MLGLYSSDLICSHTSIVAINAAHSSQFHDLAMENDQVCTLRDEFSRSRQLMGIV